MNGFRYFWIASREGGWKLCRCGWRPDLGPHYSKNPLVVDGHVKHALLDLGIAGDLFELPILGGYLAAGEEFVG